MNSSSQNNMDAESIYTEEDPIDSQSREGIEPYNEVNYKNPEQCNYSIKIVPS